MDYSLLFYGSDEIAKQIGKSSGETDIKYYHTKRGDSEITILYPFKFPERIQPLINSASVSEKALVEIQSLDKFVGELLLVLDYYGINDVGVISDDTTFSTVQKITRGMNFKLSKVEKNMGSIYDFLDKFPEPSKFNKTMIFVDQAFPVKGVGTVVLGFVMGGTVKKHQQLKSYPNGKIAEVRSIQIMDVDRESAVPYSRVGLALKGVEVDDVMKGTILSEDQEIELVDSLELNIKISQSVKIQPRAGEKIQVNFAFNNVNAVISDFDNGKILVDVDKKIAKIEGIVYSITDLNISPRILGAGIIGNNY